MDPEPLFEGVADAPPRVERGGGVLMDILDVAAPAARLFRRQAADDLAVEPDFARGLALQAQHGAAERRLAAAGFADEAEDLAGPHRQADPADRAHRPAGSAAASGARRRAARSRRAISRIGSRRSSCADRSPARRKARNRPGARRPARSRCGGRSAQIGRASAQRGAKRQPGGARNGDGTAPGMPTNESARSGWQASSARVYGCFGRREDAPRRPGLDALPGIDDADVVAQLGDDAEIVRDEQHRQAEFARPDRAADSRICCCVVTSSAVVGSSATTSAGEQASAAAISSRCRCPPENWCG